jgi:hypothetical protein
MQGEAKGEVMHRGEYDSSIIYVLWKCALKPTTLQLFNIIYYYIIYNNIIISICIWKYHSKYSLYNLYMLTKKEKLN